jgi:hypothetical protein
MNVVIHFIKQHSICQKQLSLFFNFDVSPEASAVGVKWLIEEPRARHVCGVHHSHRHRCRRQGADHVS